MLLDLLTAATVALAAVSGGIALTGGEAACAGPCLLSRSWCEGRSLLAQWSTWCRQAWRHWTETAHMQAGQPESTGPFCQSPQGHRNGGSMICSQTQTTSSGCECEASGPSGRGSIWDGPCAAPRFPSALARRCSFPRPTPPLMIRSWCYCGCLRTRPPRSSRLREAEAGTIRRSVEPLDQRERTFTHRVGGLRASTAYLVTATASFADGSAGDATVSGSSLPHSR